MKKTIGLSILLLISGCGVLDNVLEQASEAEPVNEPEQEVESSNQTEEVQGNTEANINAELETYKEISSSEEERIHNNEVEAANNNETNESEVLEKEESAEQTESSAAISVGNSGGNLAQGGRVEVQNDTVYISNLINDTFGIYELPLEGTENPQLLVEGDVSHLHATDDKLYYIEQDIETFKGGAVKAYSFETGETETIMEGQVEHLQMARGLLWFPGPHGGEGGVLSNYTYDIHTEELTDLNDHSVKYTITDDYHIVQIESFIIHDHASLEEEGAILADDVSGETFIDGDNFYYASWNGLKQINLLTEETTLLVEDEIETFNVKGDDIYYVPVTDTMMEREMYHISSQGEAQQTEEPWSEIYLFEDFMIPIFTGQNVIDYQLEDYNTGENSSLYFESPETH
ncbi:DUF5050 domain-containing protein [Alkalicoccus daliensis]|uniref:Prolow-density lipoprotein receptor-related protein 1-like beta-propeller domain-containing protein n=1 Tax=Alkalicoccus daliensis TaxID=745820 RepID=A0A1H0IYX3_9BACI|nr:DUF5050 domain-containing protein [Alkalicoccus daliensis]SDO36707.1 protein of unknown function [Alkalicoccus daliensis]